MDIFKIPCGVFFNHILMTFFGVMNCSRKHQSFDEKQLPNKKKTQQQQQQKQKRVQLERKDAHGRCTWLESKHSIKQINPSSQLSLNPHPSFLPSLPYLTLPYLCAFVLL
jgi:hypothetical protein